jgi:hypothetical protein
MRATPLTREATQFKLLITNLGFMAVDPRFSESGEWIVFGEIMLLMEKTDAASNPDGESNIRSDAGEAFGWEGGRCVAKISRSATRFIGEEGNARSCECQYGLHSRAPNGSVG